MNQLHRLIDWTSYLIVNSDKATNLKRFSDHWDLYQQFIRGLPTYEVEGMNHINWTELLKEFPQKKAALTAFGEAYDEAEEQNAKRLAAEQAFAKNLEPAIHAVYEEAGKNVLPEPQLIAAVLYGQLKLPFAMVEEKQESIKDFIDQHLGSDDLFGIIRGPGGGLARMKDRKGKKLDHGKSTPNFERRGKGE